MHDPAALNTKDLDHSKPMERSSPEHDQSTLAPEHSKTLNLTSGTDMATYTELEMNIVRWAEDRKIIPNSNPLAQAIKTTEEVAELLTAINKGDRKAAIDAYGDVLVTLIIGAALADLNLVSCLESAWLEIKDRKGYLGADGIFYKEA